MASSIKGRGAFSQPPGRFDKLTKTFEGDGWYEDEVPTRPGTIVLPETARTLISRNKSPDIHFSASINPYRGCEHGCPYCMSGDTPILMSDGTTQPLAEIRPGDEIIGTKREGWYRRYVATRVSAQWSVIKPAYRVTLEDGTSLVTGPDHRFLTERGWKFVTNAQSSNTQRAHLTTNNKLMGVGQFSRAVPKDSNYQSGYLCGMIRGDGLLRSYLYRRKRGGFGLSTQFRLALCDDQALLRTRGYLQNLDIATREFVFAEARAGRRHINAIGSSSRPAMEMLRQVVDGPKAPEIHWHAGFLAGIFDAEGSYSQGILRLSNTDAQLIRWIERSLRELGFKFCGEHYSRGGLKPISVVRIVGGLREHLRFFHIVDPAITRKRDITGQAVKSEARLAVTRIEPLGKAMRLYDITTGTEDFIANGVVSHNCYARPSHAYVGLSPGLDFETRLFYKADAAKVLEAELNSKNYQCTPITLGANTDPYQPIERIHKVTRSVLEVLLRYKHPVSITTKGALVARDVDLLAELARDGLTRVMFSIPTLDSDLKRVLEPRAASSAAKLKAMRVLSEAGVPVGVLVAPIIPVLTEHEIEAVLEASREAGATAAGYTLLRLPWEVKDLFREWLAEHFPDRAEHVMSVLRSIRGGRDNDPQFGTRMHATGPVAQLIRQRFQLAVRRLGFPDDRGAPMPTHLFRSPLRTHPQLALEL
jgi:DNA repair photolyase